MFNGGVFRASEIRRQGQGQTEFICKLYTTWVFK